MPKCLPGSFPRRQGHSRNRRGKSDLKIPAYALRLLRREFYDLRFQLIRLQMIEYLVVHLGTFYK